MPTSKNTLIPTKCHPGFSGQNNEYETPTSLDRYKEQSKLNASIMTISENKAVVVRFNREFLERGNADVLKEIVADDFINHTAPGAVSNNVEGLKQFVAMLHKGFSNFNIEIQEQIGENDLVATRKTMQATHTGEIMGHQPTGKRVIFNIMDFVRLRDGKYVEHWGRNDIMQVIQQL